MNNQAAQTMPELPRPALITERGRTGFTDDQMHQYARDYAAALSQAAGVAPRGVATGDTPTLYDVLMALDPRSRGIVVSAIKEGAPPSVAAMLAAPAASGGECKTDADLPGMWERADLIGGMTDSEPQPPPAASVSERARDMLFAQYLRSGMSEEKAGRLTAHVRDTQPECLRAIEQALTQQRGSDEPVATLQVCPPNSDGTAAYFMDRARDTDAFSKLEPGHYKLFTTPQPSADAVLVPRGAAETARTVAEEWLAMFSDIPGLEKYERYTYGPAVEQLRDELESLLGRGG